MLPSELATVLVQRGRDRPQPLCDAVAQRRGDHRQPPGRVAPPAREQRQLRQRGIRKSLLQTPLLGLDQLGGVLVDRQACPFAGRLLAAVAEHRPPLLAAAGSGLLVVAQTVRRQAADLPGPAAGVRDQLKRDAIFEVLVAQRGEHILVKQLRQHDPGERVAGLVGLSLDALGEVLVVELEPAADPSRWLAGTGEVAAGELNVAASRADHDVPPVCGRHPGLQPGEESGHVLARERAGSLAAVLARVKIVGEVAEPAHVALRRLGAQAGHALDRVALRRLAKPSLVDVGEVHLTVLADPEHPQIPYVLGPLLLRRRGHPLGRNDADLDRSARLVAPRQLPQCEHRADASTSDIRPRHPQPIQRSDQRVWLDQ